MSKQLTHPRRGVLVKALCRAEVSDLGAGSDGGAKASFVIATEDVARDNHTIKADGWKLDRYMQNPVVLWNHGFDFELGALPVGKSLRTAVEGGKLVADVEFVPRDLSAIGFTIGEMVRRGFLNATSVRWDPIKWVVDEPRGGIDFLEQELLELSVVAVPSDAGALATARSAGIDLAPLRDYAARILDGQLSQHGLVALPRAAAEKLWGALGDRRVLVEVPTRTEPVPAPPPPAPQPAPVPAATEQQPQPARADTEPEQPPACAACQAALTPDAKFCAACGEAIARADDEELVIEDDTEAQADEDELVLEDDDMRAAIATAIEGIANDFRRDVTGRIAPR